MYIRIEGEGTPIVLLHGWGLNSTYMETLFAYFKNNYKVCMLDLPGFGKSVPLSKPYTLKMYVDYIKTIIDTNALHNPIFIAHSFGCRIAFMYASMYPTRYIIATGAAGIKPKRHLFYYMKVYAYKISKHLPFTYNGGSEDYQKADPLLKKTLVYIVNEDNRKHIEKIVCPILLVWGENDAQTPLWMAYTIQKLNKNTTLILFEKDDHFAYLHQIQRFIQVCDIALKGVK